MVSKKQGPANYDTGKGRVERQRKALASAGGARVEAHLYVDELVERYALSLDDSKLCDRIAQVLKDTGRKQARLAAEAGVSRSLVTQWLNGTVKSISLDTARNIARMYGYNPGWLLRGEMPQRGSDSTLWQAPLDADFVTPEMQALIDRIVAIDTKGGEERVRLIALIECALAFL